VGTDFKAIVTEINNQKTTWTAVMPEQFASVEDVKAYLGAFLPGDDRYDEPQVEEIAVNDVLPNSFDARTQWPKCTVIGNIRDQSACGSCLAFGSVSSFQDRACIATGKDIKYSVEDTETARFSRSYSIRGESQIQTEIQNNGPVYVAFAVYSDFPTYKRGVYQPTSRRALGGHAVEAIGWGTENGIPYWLMKNSWSEQWGDHGTFKIIRGKNSCGIESSVSAGTIFADVEEDHCKLGGWTLREHGPCAGSTLLQVAFTLLLVTICLFCTAGCFALHRRRGSQNYSSAEDRTDLNAEMYGVNASAWKTKSSTDVIV
jgi:hypothetical protein